MQNIADCFSNMLDSYNIAGWVELEMVSLPTMYICMYVVTKVPHFQINPGQSQMLLKNSERFALLLAENLEAVGLSQTIELENISKNLYYFIIIIFNECFGMQ